VSGTHLPGRGELLDQSGPREDPRSPVDPAAIELDRETAITIDVGQWLRHEATQPTAVDVNAFDASDQLSRSPDLAPLFGLVARSLSSAIGVLDLMHFRVLILLSGRDSMSARELVGLTAMKPRNLLHLLDAMEAVEWIIVATPGRGVAEKVAITEKGSEMVEQVTSRRQQQIDGVLNRVSSDERSTIADAFNAFAAAAREPTMRKPRQGIAP
jgi:DNA-binding MarR family transcriptional regulator